MFMKTPKNLLIYLTFLCALLWQASGQDNVIISEFMTSNLEAIEDEDDDPSDWIEFHNPTGSTIDLRDHFLTDDRRNLRKWKVPGALSVAPNGYKLVFASAKNRGGVFISTFHTNFELSNGGEYLALVAPDGQTVLSEFANSYPEQRTGISYGIDENGSARYFESPTPLAANGAGREDLPPRVADTKFSVTRGFYESPITVAITTATEGATIYYSTDGSDPSAGSVFVPGKKYTEPLVIDETTMLRARAFKDGIEPTNIDTHTYIFVDSVLTQSDDQPGLPTRWDGQTADYGIDPEVVADYSDRIDEAFKAIPSLSLVTDSDNLWANDGLYLNTTQAATDGSGAGFRYEFEVSAELLKADGSKGFQIQAGLRAQGGASRNADRAPKHALSLRFRREYGAGRLEYPVLQDSPQQSYNTLHLRARYNNTWYHNNSGQRDRALYMRDQWARDSMLDMGTTSGGHGDYVHLYLNGLYWGIYMLQERMDASHYADYYGGRSDEYDAVNGGRATSGSLSSYNEMRDAARDKNWSRIVERLDVDNYIDWHIIQRFGSNRDWKNDGNWKAAGGGSGNGLWRFYAWDTERILEGVREGVPGPSADPSGIFNSLDDVPEFKRRFADRVHQHLFNRGALTSEQNIARLQKRAAQLDLAIIAESARWGDHRRSAPYERDNEWVSERDRLIEDYFPERTDEVIDQYQSAGLYPQLLGVDYSQYGGRVPAGHLLTLSSEGFSLFTPGKIYFTTDGSDPQAADDSIAATATEYSSPITLNDSVTVKARGRSNGTWSALSEAFFAVGTTPPSSDSIIVSELMYHPGAPTAEESAAGHVNSDDFEFFELSNVSDQPIDLAGVSLGKGARMSLLTGPLSVLAPGAQAVFVKDPEAFRYRYGAEAPVNGVFSGTLDNDSESIEILAEDGSAFIAFEYSDGGAWPQTADGNGFSLVFDDAAADPDKGASWRASAQPGGSPGSLDSSPSFGIVINEILTNSTAPDVDAVELYNSGDAAVDVSGWFLTDNPNEPMKHTIAAGSTIPAGGYLVILEDNDEDPANNDSLPAEYFGGSFSLSSRGDAIHVFSASGDGELTGYSDGFSFGDAEEGITFGRFVDSQGRVEYPAQSTSSLGTINAVPRLGNVVISEIMYHASDLDDAGEYVELINRSDSAINLSGWRLSGVGFTFPVDTSIAAGEVVLVSRSDETTLRGLYSAIPAATAIYGGYGGRLSNDGERLTIERPGETYLDNGVEKTTSIIEDSLRYNDAEPWPTAADGSGRSLERVSISAYADEVMNWAASSAEQGSPGSADGGVEPQPGITFAQWRADSFSEDQLGNEAISGSLADPDNDGLANRLEYLFATDPLGSNVAPISVELSNDVIQIRYRRRSNLQDTSIQIEISQDLEAWQPAGDSVTQGATAAVGADLEDVTLTMDSSQAIRFVRLSVPQ